MQHALARQAEAERNRRAKVINAEGEFQAADRLAQAADVIRPNPVTLQLRYLQALSDISANQASTIVFPLPLDLVRPLLERGEDPRQTAPASPALRRLPRSMRAAVVGHVEWIEFGRVDHVPAPGEIVHVIGLVAGARRGRGGGRRAARQARGRGDALHGARRRRARPPREAELERLGLRVEAGFRPEPQRRGFVHVDAAGERTITVIGSRLGPAGRDPLPWDELAETDAVYFTAGDVEAVRAARAARTLVSTARGLETLREAGVRARRAGRERARPGRALRVRRARPAAALRDPHRRAATAASTRAPTGERGAGRRRPCPDRSATSTAAATASPPA